MLEKTSLAVLVLAVTLAPVLSQTNAAPSKSAPTTPAQTQTRSGEKPAVPDSSRQDYSKEAFVIERYSTRVTEENDGTGVREVTAEVKMLADAGVKAFGVLSFTYTSANEAVELDYVRVRKADGTVVKTPDYNIQDMPGEVTRTAPLYSDIHEKHVAVKGLGVGDVLEYLMRYRVTKPEVPGHFWYEYNFNKQSAVRDERLEISVPSAKYVKIVSPEFKPEITEEGARRVYRWTHKHLEVKEKGPYEVPRRTPPNPDVQMTTFASWEDVGNWYGSLQKEPVAVTPAIQAKAAELTKGLKSDDEKLRALYSFVALKYHYIGLDFGIGRYQPHAADDVLDNGYGDCKDKHTLLASLLKAAGYEAWPALIHANRKLDADVPSPAQFNHVITVVPKDGQYTWLDTTPEVAPYGLLLLQLRNKQALVVPINQPPRLMTTPQNPPMPARQEFTMEGKLGSDGTFTGHAEQSYEGDVEVMLRAAFRQLSESQWRDGVQRFSYGMNFGGEVSNVKITPPNELDKPFRISYDYVRKDYADWENHHTNPPLPPMGLEVQKDAKDRKPPEPLLLGALGRVSYHARMQLPEGYRVTVPSPVHLMESYAEYWDDTAVENGVLTATRELVIKKNEVPLDEWEGYRKFGIALSDDEFGFISLTRTSVKGNNVETTVILDKKTGGDPPKGNKTAAEKPGADAKKNDNPAATSDHTDFDSLYREGYDALQQRDFQRAQEVYENLIARDSEYPGAHFNLGVAMMSRNETTDALDQFQKEEQISPSDPKAYQISAAYFAQAGRRDEAIQEWRKLLKVDPDNRTAAAALGGFLYQAGKYADAIQVLEAAVKASPDSPGLQVQLGEAYLKNQQRDQAVASLRRAVEQKSNDPDTLNNVAYMLADNKIDLDTARQYAEKAVKELDEQMSAAKASEDAGLRVTYEYSLVWDTLGWIYFQQGDAKRAESLVRAAWLLGEDSLVGEHLGEIYEKEGKIQQAVRSYEFALSVSRYPSFTPAAHVPDSMKQYKAQAEEITARYEKLTGKKPTIGIRRLPNGQWSQTPAEQLRHTREVTVTNDTKISGYGQFIVVLDKGKTESAHYLNGDEVLKPLAIKLAAAHYPLELPSGSEASLTVRVNVSCHAANPCTAELSGATSPGRQFAAPAY